MRPCAFSEPGHSCNRATPPEAAVHRSSADTKPNGTERLPPAACSPSIERAGERRRLPGVAAVDRILEPEIMDGDAEAVAYARADFSDSNIWYVEHLIAGYSTQLTHVLDLGCGPADVPIRLARAVHHTHITAVDGSAA